MNHINIVELYLTKAVLEDLERRERKLDSIDRSVSGYCNICIDGASRIRKGLVLSVEILL